MPGAATETANALSSPLDVVRFSRSRRSPGRDSGGRSSRLPVRYETSTAWLCVPTDDDRWLHDGVTMQRCGVSTTVTRRWEARAWGYAQGTRGPPHARALPY
jgi:hypothetical protein